MPESTPPPSTTFNQENMSVEVLVAPAPVTESVRVVVSKASQTAAVSPQQRIQVLLAHDGSVVLHPHGSTLSSMTAPAPSPVLVASTVTPSSTSAPGATALSRTHSALLERLSAAPPVSGVRKKTTGPPLSASLVRTPVGRKPAVRSSRAGVIEATSLGGRSLPTAALAVSVMASAANSLSVVSFVGHYYAHGFNLMWVLAAIPLAAYVTAVSVVPLLYHLRVVSIFQYLRMRFDNKVGVAACIIYFILSQTLGAVGIYSAATAVSTMFHVPLLASNLAIGLAGTVYTALGGLRSVVWADCVQALVMFAAPLSIIGKVLYDSGSASPPLRSMSDFNYAEYVFRTDFDVSSDENIWSTLVSAMPYTLVRVAFDQMSVQRFMAARTLQAAKRTAVAGGLFVLFFFTIAITAGVALIYWYRDCDPVLRGAIKTFDQVVPYYMRERLSDVATLRGFFLAGLVGASTSTVSSIVNSHAATFYIDVISPYLKISEQRATIVMRLLGAVLLL
ncbi:putative sodium-dependent multivitamin transporter [Rhipicephalus sanguineus]|uniref:putative sodium-dependent multivitamin transporter n=1 Tax=Rhipicephalus sanguineus TaxID=34632 RepID=UPI0020C3855C|nr:putative sodium-dependent multivitamin transporter [Rhipicephalus sanguineus]